MTLLYFIVGLGLLIFIHELGHFLVAKANGIRVERFSLGFGPRLLKFRYGETEYCISALPLGGYVKMTGQEDFGEEEIIPMDDPKAFNSKSLGARLSVVLAGPFMNLLLPFVLMPLVFLLGRVEPRYLQEAPVLLGVTADSAAGQAGLLKGDRIVEVNGQSVANWGEVLKGMAKPAETQVSFKVLRGDRQETSTVSLKLREGEKGGAGVVGFEPRFFIDQDAIVGEVMANSPAQSSGLKVGDRIVAIGDQPIENWISMSEAVQSSQGKEILVKVLRGEKPLEFTLRPTHNAEAQRYTIGISKFSDPTLYEKHRYGLGQAIVLGARENWELCKMTFKVLKDLVTLKASYKELGGPIRIAQISAKAAEQGLGNFLFLLCFLSIQLGVLNLLPIPVLDGGHVVFMAYEAVARKPLSPKKRLIAQQVGMFLLLTLMVLVTVNDIDSVWGFKDMVAKIRGWFG